MVVEALRDAREGPGESQPLVRNSGFPSPTAATSILLLSASVRARWTGPQDARDSTAWEGERWACEEQRSFVRRPFGTDIGTGGICGRVGGDSSRAVQAWSAQPRSIGSGVLNPAIARAGTPKPRPIPGGLDIPDLGQFHVYAPAKGNELNTITDFKGLVAATEIQGTGTGTDSPVPPATSLVYDVDMRIMQGTFVATDGKSHEGTFGFV